LGSPELRPVAGRVEIEPKLPRTCIVCDVTATAAPLHPAINPYLLAATPPGATMNVTFGMSGFIDEAPP
jgi:hypothetical protein